MHEREIPCKTFGKLFKKKKYLTSTKKNSIRKNKSVKMTMVLKAIKSGLGRTQVMCLERYPVETNVPVMREMSPVNKSQKISKSNLKQCQIKIKV